MSYQFLVAGFYPTTIRVGAFDAPRLDLVDQSGPFVQRSSLVELAEHIERRSERRPVVVDLCAGSGENLLFLAHRNWLVRGFEQHALLAEAANRRLGEEFAVCDGSWVDEMTREVDLILGFDDFANQLLDLDGVKSFLLASSCRLSERGAVVFQRERTTTPAVGSVVGLALDSGFESCWQAIPSSLCTAVPEGTEHVGTRDVFVAMK